MPSVCLYFQVHQPHRLKKYGIFSIGKEREYFNDQGESNLNNRKIMEKVSGKCYLPSNKTLLGLLRKHSEFKVSFSISGTALEQFESFCPKVLESFQELAETGRVEFLSETYYHSLSFIYSKEEFREQVKLHKKKIKSLFDVTPTVFRNTELIYNNDLALEVENMGFKGIISEGADHILGWRSPNFIYRPQGTSEIKLLLKNYKLSDDIAFRFGNRDWAEYPLTAEKFANWVSDHNGNGEIINLFMDYETFGEHQWKETGIFDFLKHMPGRILDNPDNNFVTPGEAVKKFNPVADLDIPNFISWADIERDLSAWRSNEIQNDALSTVYGMEKDVIGTGDDRIMEDWRRLQTSDHFYYMCTKWFADGDVHKYFNPYESPYEAFISYMNVIKDLKLRIAESSKDRGYVIPIKKIISKHN